VLQAVQAGLSWWDVVSPFKGYGATLALIFVLTAAAVKAVIEDRKRHKEDHKTNNSAAAVVQKDECVSPGARLYI
jgi:phospholipid-transporting ATPase